VQSAEVPQADDRLLTADEVANIMRVTRSWVYAETRRNGLPHVRLGRSRAASQWFSGRARR
jgi:excisionase family DNA binding protein